MCFATNHTLYTTATNISYYNGFRASAPERMLLRRQTCGDVHMKMMKAAIKHKHSFVSVKNNQVFQVADLCRLQITTLKTSAESKTLIQKCYVSAKLI